LKILVLKFKVQVLETKGLGLGVLGLDNKVGFYVATCVCFSAVQVDPEIFWRWVGSPNDSNRRQDTRQWRLTNWWPAFYNRL